MDADAVRRTKRQSRASARVCARACVQNKIGVLALLSEY